jgi:hypothetical protein
MEDSERAALQASVELLHNCKARYVRSEDVSVTAGSVTIEREVAVFELQGASAPLAYAWSDPVPEKRSVKHQVVLHQGVVKSAQLAIAGFFLSGNAI